MKESYRQKPLLTLAAGVAAVALLLAGCGGGSTVSKDPKPVAVDLTSVNAAPGLVPMAGTLPLKAGASGDLGDITFTCAAGGDDCSVTVTVTDGKAAAMATGGMVTAAPSQAYTKRIDDARKAAIVAATKQAKSKSAAIMAEDNPGTGEGTGLGGAARTEAVDTDNDSSNDEYTLAISRDSAGTTITVTDPDMDADDDPKFMADGGMLVRTMKADADGNVMAEKVMVMTNIEAPEAVPFADFESDYAGTKSQALNARDLDDAVDADGDGTATNDYTAHTVLAGTAALRKLIVADDFTAKTAAVLTFTQDDGNTGDTDEAYEGAGTYNGTKGTYRCEGNSPCTVTIGDTDTTTTGVQLGITETSGTWVFTPDKDATTDQPDYDYLHWGFWLKQTTDKDGAVTYDEIETFAGSSVTASEGGSDGLDSVDGSASYKGDAMGVYVMNNYKSDGSIDSASSGHFTADVSLEVNFKGSSIAADDHGKVTGTINNFMLSGNEANSWSVALAGTRADGANNIGTTGTAKGGVEGKDGSFTATFYGATPVTPATDDPVTNRVASDSVAGEFNADFSNGMVAGGFGATKTK